MQYNNNITIYKKVPKNTNIIILKTFEEIKSIAINTIINESNAISNLKDRINDDFAKCVELIQNTDGRVVITGIGKSANIATKIVATLNSTGTPSIFIHAADAIHGDLGAIRQEDIIICISNSGNTPEIKVLVPLLKIRGSKLIAMVGNTDSFLAKEADLIINTTVEKEACPNNLAPTSSTTAQLVMGDALAVCLFETHGLSVDDFAKFHPGGSIGRRLYLKVSDLCVNNEVPQVDINDNLNIVIIEISSKRLGATAVLDEGKLVGVITDGDLRRMLEKNIKLDNVIASDIMSHNPKTINKETLVVDAFSIMRNNNITQLLVLDGDKYFGVIHLHDIIKEGVV